MFEGKDIPIIKINRFLNEKWRSSNQIASRKTINKYNELNTQHYEYL